MYKAMEYPKRGRATENIYITDSVRRRFEGLRGELECVGLSVKAAAQLSGLRYESLSDYVNRISYPTMLRYFKLAEFMGWDISRDVNWHYAHVLHSPKEIQQRVRRLYPDCKDITAYSRQLSMKIGYAPGVITVVMNYGKSRSPHVYGALMHWVMAREKERGLDNPLDLEL